MTYAAVCEIMLHLNNFTIFDDYSDGVYKIRASIYYERPSQIEQDKGVINDKEVLKVDEHESQKYYARPYLTLENTLRPKEDRKEKRFFTENVFLKSGRLQIENRWGYNQLHIDEIIMFRIDLPCFPRVWQGHLYLETELMVMVDTVYPPN